MLWPDDDDGEINENIDTLQEIFGYLVSGSTRQQKMFLLVGPRRGGKGTIARVLRSMLGAHNVAGPTLASLGTNFGLQPLVGKLAAIISDARLGTKSDVGVIAERLLSISGEDTLTIDRKYLEPVTLQLPTRFVVLSNELPRLADASGALASRFIVLVMTESFYGKEDPGLTDRLIKELPGIFNWALDGAERLTERGHFLMPKASSDAVRAMEDLSSPTGAFIRDTCVIGPERFVSTDLLFETWKKWCEANGQPAGNVQVFGRNLHAAVPGLKVIQPRDNTGKQYRAYQGVGRRSDLTMA
jgi:putative DNA primase/helicase